MCNSTLRQTVLTGDRPTGPLHLGHYAGSLKNRISLQETTDQFILIADLQALTDNAHRSRQISSNVLEVALDYLAVGINPEKSTICVQSSLPALAELSMLFLNFVTVSRLERNPTIREEIRHRGFERDVPAGFLCYPAAQAADILAFNADMVPVGTDQAPMIELTNELAIRLNTQTGQTIFKTVTALIPQAGRLPGIDGKAKMSKSAGNALALNASPAEITAAVRAMYTDPNHLKVSDPGQVEGNVVFAFLDAFDPDLEAIGQLKAHYKHGGLGDMALKKRLDSILQNLIAPIRERRAKLAQHPDDVFDILRDGTKRAKIVTQNKLEAFRCALDISVF